jgi:prepilin-type N-terminal cleavage/methylation domain-containing protein
MNRLGRERGFTLIELLVAMVILLFVITAIFRVLNVQIYQTVHQRGITMSRTEAQVGYRVLKWDFLMAGFGTPLDEKPYETVDSLAEESSDAVLLRGAALGLTRRMARWSYRIDYTQDSTSTPIVRFWNDSTRDLRGGDYVLVLSDRRERIAGPIYIASVEYIGGDSLRIYLGEAIESPVYLRVPLGTYFVALDTLGDYKTATYWVDDGVLKRDGTPLLRGVYAFKVHFGLDYDGDGVMDEWLDDLSGVQPLDLRSYMKLTRVSLLIRSKKKSRATIADSLILLPDEALVGEPVDTVVIPESSRKYTFTVISTLLKPRNL